MKNIINPKKVLRLSSIMSVSGKLFTNSGNRFNTLWLGKLCVLALLFAISFGIASASTDTNTLKIGGSYDYPPYSFIDENGQPAGFSVELSKAIASVLHKNIKFHLQAWGEVRKKLEIGNTDLVHDIVYSTERSKIYSFSKPHYISTYAVFTKKGSPELKSVKDLNGKRIIVIKGDIGADYLREKGINSSVQTIANYKDLLILLAESDYQYAMMDQLAGLYWINKLKLDDIYTTNLSLFPLKYCFASSINNKELILEIDGAMSILMQNHKYDEIYTKWMVTQNQSKLLEWALLKQYYWIILIVISLAIILIAWNITMQKMVAQKTRDLESINKSLAESKERYKALLSANPDFIFMFDKKRKFVDFYGGIETLLFPPEQFIGKSIWDVLPQYLAELTDQKLKELFTTGNIQNYEYQLEIDNKIKHYEGRMVKSGEFHSIAIVRDISERKFNELLLQRQNQELEAQYEEYLQLNEVLKQTNDDLFFAKSKAEDGEKELASLMSNLPGLVYRCLDDENWTMKFVSDGSLLLTGYSQEELLDNNTISYNQLIHPEDRNYVKNTIQNSLANSNYFIIDYRIIDKSGRTKYVWERGHRMNTFMDGVPMLQGFITDISDRKFAEDMLHRQNQELEAQYEEYIQLNEMLRRTNSDLEIAKAKAEESDKLKTAFLQNMSHEIRTPLNGIIGYSSMLINTNIQLDEIENYASIIQQSGNRLIEIVNNILDISKIETGQIEIQKQLVSLNSVIADVYNFFLHSANQKNLQLTYSNFLDNSNCIIYTDELRINQILTNLIANALKFTHDGSIEFGYTIAQNNRIVFFVKDTGIGISEENIGIIFDRFSQIDLSISRGYEGAGLGLAISKGLVELLGGEIWLESELGKGTTFYFSTPYNSEIQEEFNIEKNIDIQPIAKSNDNLKILIVEDDAISESLISIVIKNISREILKARNGLEAVEICKQNSDIDLILMDVKMPQMSGIDATKAIREFNSDVIIIAQTAFGFNSEREQIMNAGCNEYISKPIEISKLIRLINKHRNKEIKI